MPLLHFVQKLASNDNFDIVFRQVENLEAHIFKISVSICLAKHSPHFVMYAPSEPHGEEEEGFF